MRSIHTGCKIETRQPYLAAALNLEREKFTSMKLISVVYEPKLGCFRRSTFPGRHRVHVRPSGERYPLYESGDDALDLGLCIYIAYVVRRSESVNTRLQLLRGATSFLGYTRDRGIWLENRFQTGTFLSRHELFGFDRFLVAQTGADTQTRARRHRDALTFARFLSHRHASWIADTSEQRLIYTAAAEVFFQDFASVIRCSKAGKAERKGLRIEARRALADFLTDPSGSAALWQDGFVARRNRLLLLCFILLGHRVGEWLSMRVQDLDLQARLYWIRRRPNSPADPRPLQPLVKGRSRELIWPVDLVEQMQAYLADRAIRLPAPDHGFLFVTREGRPMSRSLVTKVFAELHGRLPALGIKFSPHVLRHTWNDLFSESADDAGLSPERELRARMLAMGWSSRDTAATYTRRSDARAVDEVADTLQDALFGTGGRAA